MKVSHGLSGGFVAAALVLAFAPPPAFADAPSGGTISGSATVVSPTGDIVGQWVTPVGTTNPLVSPGANVAFSSKHSISAAGYPANATISVNFTFDLEEGTRNEDGTFNFISTLDVSTLSVGPTVDSNGNWSDSTYTNYTLSKTKFVGAQPSAEHIPKYVALAETYNTVGYSLLSASHVDFKVSMPYGPLPPSP